MNGYALCPKRSWLMLWPDSSDDFEGLFSAAFFLRSMSSATAAYNLEMAMGSCSNKKTPLGSNGLPMIANIFEVKSSNIKTSADFLH